MLLQPFYTTQVESQTQSMLAGGATACRCILISELVNKATIRTGDTAELYVWGEGESREWLGEGSGPAGAEEMECG